MPILSIRGLGGAIAGLQANLELVARSKTRSDLDTKAILEQIQRLLVPIESALVKRGGGEADLGRPSLRGYLWLKWLSQADHLAMHLETLALAIRLAEKSLKAPRPVSARLYATSNLVQTRPVKDQIELIVNQGFAGAPGEIIQPLIEAAVRRKKHPDLRPVRQYAQGDAFQAIQKALSAPKPTVQLARENSHGSHYHLEEVFQRVNQAYFSGQIDMPRLTWSQNRTRRKFGHYDFLNDTLMVSRSLDDPEVPGFVVDAVMHHELLHKHLGVRVVNGRRYTHTTEFRTAERQFAAYDQAEAFLKKLAKPRKRKVKARVKG